MYSNLTKAQAFPLGMKIPSRPKCFKPFHTSNTQSLAIGSHPKPSHYPIAKNFNFCSHETGHETIRNFYLVKSLKYSTDYQHRTLGMGKPAIPRKVSYVLPVRSTRQLFPSTRARNFSNFYNRKFDEGSSVVRDGKQLPWLASSRGKDIKDMEEVKIKKSNRSTWEESAKRVKKGSGNSPLKKSGNLSNRSSWEESAKRLETVAVPKSGSSSPEAFPAAESGISEVAGNGSGNDLVDMVEEKQIDHSRRSKNFEEDEEEGGEEVEVIHDPRWDKIKNRFQGMVDVKAGFEKPELRRWNKQESWGRKTWKEATESNIPKMVGEGIYGVGPVLAALSAGRREFYALYVQEGLDLSSNNRKKKDKKGFEKVLKMAEKVGLSIKEASKHDLNMVVDNRPHQGLVLDASPLEMVRVKELDPVSVDEAKDCLWVALDEVTDPQNLGAIIRSAYYFGVSGVVLCAKNSAPLSGVVSKASAGSLELMELRYCKNMMQFLVSSSQNGWRVVGGSVSSKSIPLDEVSPGPPTILVLGSEGTGLRPLVERSCTQLVRILGNIPVDVTASEFDDEGAGINGGSSGKDFQSFLAVESLNVSVAAGVLLHHFGNCYKNYSQMGNEPTDALQ
ncbi:rRNA methyltransferase [Quillaja saponaria]|uniref:rRNA methyltransferase 1, mitochondrial n=1 Tax=Quillaja saponaria TaxID=32244 RepID=A0AAD7Q2T3_QUISA|nr:rRNA methyltransferase [Quillaja saponaria]